MMPRKYIFPRVIEMNYQAGARLGINIYLIDGGSEYVLIDVGFTADVEDIIELIRKMDFSLSACKMIIATHADADHIQGIPEARDVLRCKVAAHSSSVAAMESADAEMTFGTIKAQNIRIPMKPVKVDIKLTDGQVVKVGDLKLEVWHTPGHTDGQLAFKMGNLLFVGDNIYKDGCVGVIDAHHGSNIPDFIRSLERILADDSEYLLPSHGPVFKRDNAVIRATIERLKGYQYMADFGTCAVGWPLLDEWERDVVEGRMPVR